MYSNDLFFCPSSEANFHKLINLGIISSRKKGGGGGGLSLTETSPGPGWLPWKLVSVLFQKVSQAELIRNKKYRCYLS